MLGCNTSDVKTTVIILHYRGVEDTLACLASVLPQRHDALDVLLVDNGSADDLATAVASRFGTVPSLRLAENRGWAGGNNAGIAWARAHGAGIVCLLNNDTIVPPGTFDHLSAIARRTGSCLLRPAIDYADAAEGPQLDPSASPDSTPIAGHDHLFALDFAYGACLTVPVAVFDRIGVFDERFFLQLEEADLFQRAKRVGIPSLCSTAFRIVHAESRSFGGTKTAEKFYYNARNSLLLAEKNLSHPAIPLSILRGLYWAASFRAGLQTHGSVWAMARWAMSDAAHARALREAVRDYALRRFGPRRHIQRAP